VRTGKSRRYCRSFGSRSGWRSKKARKSAAVSRSARRDDGYIRAEVIDWNQPRGAYSGGRERGWWQRLLGTG
jgi:hypothetical protein